MLDYAEQTSFPVFSVENPYEVVGITKHLAALLVYDDDKDGVICSFMRALMHEDEMPLSLVLRRGISCDVNLRYPFFFVSLGFDKADGTDEKIWKNIIRFRDNLGYIFSEFQRICNTYGAKILTFGNDWKAFCLIVLDVMEPQRIYQAIVDDIQDFLAAYDCGLGFRIVAGLSAPCTNAEQIKLYYRQSDRALEFVAKSKWDQVCVSFESLGMMRFIGYLSESEKYELIEQAKQSIRPLTDADQNGGEYVKTYRMYLGSKGSLRDVADQLYIHQNTLLKRLEKTQRLLDKDIHDPFVKNEGINVFFVLDYFGIS